jgi:hypothetical protein
MFPIFQSAEGVEKIPETRIPSLRVEIRHFAILGKSTETIEHTQLCLKENSFQSLQKNPNLILWLSARDFLCSRLLAS